MKRLLLVFACICTLIAVSCSTTPTESIHYDIAEETYSEVALNPLTGNFSQSAKTLVSSMGSGWNLGNTLDATGSSTLASETSWGRPKTTAAMMTNLKKSGIKTVRIPISWRTHVNKAFTIDSAWMERVKEVVDYAINAGLYVIINIHHDNHESYYYPDSTHADQSLAYVTRIWKQVGLQFRNYDEHLIFETLNEPRLVGDKNEWNWINNNAKLRDAANQINILNQAAVDTIRATGGNNEKRFIMFAPYVASPQSAMSSQFKVPTDSATDKLILSVHAYTPYNFAMEDPGIRTFGDQQKNDIDWFINNLHTTFVNGKNIPVIIGEYGATNKNNLDARVAYFTYYVKKAHENGMCPIVWDNGNWEVPLTGKFSELYGFYNRTAGTWYETSILDAIINN